MSNVHGPTPRPSGAGGSLRIVCLVLAALALAGAIVVVVLPLPKPAAGGTCGPGAGSEPAVAAFFDPVSIGAGTPPTNSAVAAYQWQAFVGECQSSANGRMVEGLALLLVAGFFALVVHPLVRRAWHEPVLTAPAAPAAWHGEPGGDWHWPEAAHSPDAPTMPGMPPTVEHRWPPPTAEAQQPAPPVTSPPPVAPPPDQR